MRQEIKYARTHTRRLRLRETPERVRAYTPPCGEPGDATGHGRGTVRAAVLRAGRGTVKATAATGPGVPGVSAPVRYRPDAPGVTFLWRRGARGVCA